MPEPLPAQDEDSLGSQFAAKWPSAERALKNFRYVVGSVNDDALKVWADLWKEFQACTTPAGMVLPEMQDGFQPSCGWAEFLEKFWLLKHYLDYTHRLCK